MNAGATTSAPAPAPAPARRTLRRAAAAPAAVVVALAATEEVLRLTDAGVYDPPTTAWNVRPVPGGGEGTWELDPAKTHETRWDRDPYGTQPPSAVRTYAVDPSGLRGTPPPAARPALLVVGDSFTFGAGVDADDAFPVRLERMLATSGLPGPPAVLNAGVPGHATVDEAARLPTLLDRFAPRAVLVVFVPNDATTLRDDDPAADLVRARARNDPPLRLVALAQAALGRAARDRAAEETTLAPYTGADRSRWEAARLALVAMRDAATARGARFGVAYFPYLYRVGDERLAPIRDAVAATCAEAGAPFLDITTAFRGERDRALWVHPTDQHPNPRAHELAARAMVPFVEGLLR